MYRTIKRIYDNTKKTDLEQAIAYVEKAVEKGWISQDEANEIMGVA